MCIDDWRACLLSPRLLVQLSNPFTALPCPVTPYLFLLFPTLAAHPFLLASGIPFSGVILIGSRWWIVVWPLLQAYPSAWIAPLIPTPTFFPLQIREDPKSYPFWSFSSDTHHHLPSKAGSLPIPGFPHIVGKPGGRRCQLEFTVPSPHGCWAARVEAPNHHEAIRDRNSV